MATQYRFKTIMVTDENRDEFSALRDSFGGARVTDKELFSAIFNNVDFDKVKNEIVKMKTEKAQTSEKEKIKKLEAKLKEKLEKLQAAETVETEKTEKKKKNAA